MALFSIAEARAFDQAKLASESTYTDAEITAVQSAINDRFAMICGVRFEPTTATDIRRDGDGSDTLWVVHHRLISVSGCTIYNTDGTAEETFDASDLADLAVYPEGRIVRKQNGLFLKGNRNVKLTYIHGWATCPEAVKTAALRLCVDELLESDVSRRVTNMADGEMRYNFSVPGRGKTEWTGLPVVDTILRTYNESMVGMLA